MSSATDTDQLRFWKGDFGNDYIGRNEVSAEQLRARTAMWSEIMKSFIGAPPRSILEVGSNIGNNLRALRCISGATLYAVEPNDLARRRLIEDGVVEADRALGGTAASIALPDGAVDLVFTSGVLIHIHPDDLAAACREIHRVAARYIVCVEYFADKPEAIAYRGHSDKLFKRDFGSFWLDSFADLRTVAYGFTWKRLTGLDNLTWWAFEKVR